MPPQLLALFSAFSYSLYIVLARSGMRYSTPFTATLAAMAMRAITLWSAVLLFRGIPQVALAAVLVFVALGIMQTATSLLTFTGLQRIGASRSQPLRNSYPLWSAIIAIAVMNEEANLAVILGTLLVVGGVILISWRPPEPDPSYRWWDVLFSLGAAFLAGIAFPVRRYGLMISNEPLFFAALLAAVCLVSLLCCLPLVGVLRLAFQNRRAMFSFAASGVFEALGALFALKALSFGRVVVVSPIVATTPLWTLILTALVLRDVERVHLRTVIGTLCVVSGTIAITLRG